MGRGVGRGIRGIHQRRGGEGISDGVRRAVDEAEQVTGIEVPEPDGLIGDEDRPVQPVE